MLNTVLLGLILLLEVLQAAVAVIAGKRLAERRREDKLDAEEEEAQRKESLMDEGFQNIMAFSVGGRDGFGQGEG